MLFGELQLHAAAVLKVSAVWLATGLIVGSPIGSISSPFKIALATPMPGSVLFLGTGLLGLGLLGWRRKRN
jgi:lactate permease